MQSRMADLYKKVQDVALVPCLFILLPIKGAQADEHVLSDSGAIALASVIGALVLVVTIAVLCYCFRKYTLETKARSRKLAELKNNLVEYQLNDANMTQNGYVAANGHVSDKIKTYGEWRKSQRPSNLYTKNYASVGKAGTTRYTTTAGHYTTTGQNYTTTGHNTTNYRIRRGSESPPLSPRTAGQERGRSSRRQFVYQMPAGSVAVRRTVVRPKLRSKSAPPVHRYASHTGYNVVYPKYEKVGYTRNHFLSIKKPFGKKYLLPPTLVYKEQPRIVQKNVVMPVPVPEPRPAPVQLATQQQRETIKGNVYHIKFDDGHNTSSQRLSTSNGYAGTDHSMSHSRVEQQQYSYPQRTEQYTYARTEQKHSYPRAVTTSTSRTYAEPSSPIRPATYTVKYGDENYDLVNEKSNIYTLQTSGAANQAAWANEASYRKATTVYTTNDDEDTGEVFRQSISNSEVRVNVKDENKDDEQYTIVDYVEPTNTQNTDPMSSSTPRFPEHDVTETEQAPTTPVTPLRDLDNVLNGNDGSSTSNSPSSSSRRSSGSDGNQ